MEELRSTDVLDKEIRADARKKAERILAKADESCKALLDGVGKRVDDARAAAQKASQEGLALYEKNINASLPLEKQRYLVSYIHNSVVGAMNDYFDGLSAGERLEVVRRQVERAKPLLEGHKVDAQCVGLDVKAAEVMLKKEFGASLLSCKGADAVLLEDEAVAGFKRREGVILKAAGGSMLCRLTLDEKVKEIMDDQSYELASTLFGGRLPE